MDEQQQQQPQEPVVNYQPVSAPVSDGKGLSIAALVLGILGIVGGWIPVVCYVTSVCAILAVVFGAIGRKKSAAASGGKASGLATAGLVLGIISLGVAVLAFVCTVICAGALAASLAAAA